MQEKLIRHKVELCKILARIGALQFGTFTLADGRLSPYYVDLRIVPSFPDAFERVIKIYLSIIKNNIGLETFVRIAGIPAAGIPFAAVLAYSLSKPLLYVRKKEKNHGRGKRVAGILNPGDRVLLVDDLLTAGGSLLSAAEAIMSEGGVVKDALVLIDREEGGVKSLKRRSIMLHSLVRITEVAKILYDIETISVRQLNDILRQVQTKGS